MAVLKSAKVAEKKEKSMSGYFSKKTVANRNVQSAANYYHMKIMKNGNPWTAVKRNVPVVGK